MPPVTAYVPRSRDSQPYASTVDMLKGGWSSTIGRVGGTLRGRSRSPRPQPRAIGLSTQRKGTSEPIVAASSTRRRPSGFGASESSRRRTAPASALPPPRPPPTGIRFVTSMLKPAGQPVAAAYAHAARYARFFSVGPRPSGQARGQCREPCFRLRCCCHYGGSIEREWGVVVGTNLTVAAVVGILERGFASDWIRDILPCVSLPAAAHSRRCRASRAP